MKADRVVIHEGKEFVTPTEFAERIGTTSKTVNQYIREGYLIAKDVQKTGQYYLDWSTQSVAYKITRQKKEVKGGNGGHATRKAHQASPIMRVSDISTPKVGTPNLKLEDVAVPDVTVDNNVVDLSKFNPYEHKDCWILVDGEPTYDPDGKPRIDYELMKTKVMAQTYQVKLDKETRSVISKEELIPTVQGVCTVFKSSVDNIAQKYSAPLIAICESITGHEFTSEEHTQVMNILRNVPKEIFPSLQKELEKMLEDAED